MKSCAIGNEKSEITITVHWKPRTGHIPPGNGTPYSRNLPGLVGYRGGCDIRKSQGSSVRVQRHLSRMYWNLGRHHKKTKIPTYKLNAVGTSQIL